jgi:hypothetical protein
MKPKARDRCLNIAEGDYENRNCFAEVVSHYRYYLKLAPYFNLPHGLYPLSRTPPPYTGVKIGLCNVTYPLLFWEFFNFENFYLRIFACRERQFLLEKSHTFFWDMPHKKRREIHFEGILKF